MEISVWNNVEISRKTDVSLNSMNVDCLFRLVFQRIESFAIYPIQQKQAAAAYENNLYKKQLFCLT